MKRKLSTSEKIRRLIDQGYTNKAIIDKLGIKPQAVYNMRYQLNKARGLGAIGTPAPVPAEGIGTPPKKRKHTRRVRAGELASLPPTPVLVEPAEPIVVTTVRGEGLVAKPGEFKELPITMAQPTLWERVKGWFRG